MRRWNKNGEIENRQEHIHIGEWERKNLFAKRTQQIAYNLACNCAITRLGFRTYSIVQQRQVCVDFSTNRTSYSTLTLVCFFLALYTQLSRERSTLGKIIARIVCVPVHVWILFNLLLKSLGSARSHIILVFICNQYTGVMTEIYTFTQLGLCHPSSRETASAINEHFYLWLDPGAVTLFSHQNQRTALHGLFQLQIFPIITDWLLGTIVPVSYQNIG